MSGPHISDELIDRYSMGVLEEPAQADLEEHVLYCPHCQERLIETDQFLALFRATAPLAEAQPTPVWRRFGYFARISWAAAGAVLLAILFVPRYLESPKPVAVELQALRGPEAAIHIASTRPAILRFDVIPQLVAVGYRVEVVDSLGGSVLTMRPAISGGRLAARIGKLARGSYWVRVYAGELEELIAEYGLIAD